MRALHLLRPCPILCAGWATAAAAVGDPQAQKEGPLGDEPVFVCLVFLINPKNHSTLLWRV